MNAPAKMIIHLTLHTVSLVPSERDAPLLALQQCAQPERKGELRLLVEQVEHRSGVEMIDAILELNQFRHLRELRRRLSGSVVCGGGNGKEVILEEMDLAGAAILIQFMARVNELLAQVASEDVGGRVTLPNKLPYIGAHL